jgi:hypothetical protein
MNIMCLACGAHYNTDEPPGPRNQPFFELSLGEPLKEALEPLAANILDRSRLKIVVCPNCGGLKVPIDDLPDSMKVIPGFPPSKPPRR